jgi:hypothetical protein
MKRLHALQPKKSSGISWRMKRCGFIPTHFFDSDTRMNFGNR